MLYRAHGGVKNTIMPPTLPGGSATLAFDTYNVTTKYHAMIFLSPCVKDEINHISTTCADALAAKRTEVPVIPIKGLKMRTLSGIFCRTTKHRAYRRSMSTPLLQGVVKLHISFSEQYLAIFVETNRKLCNADQQKDKNTTKQTIIKTVSDLDEIASDSVQAKRSVGSRSRNILLVVLFLFLRELS